MAYPEEKRMDYPRAAKIAVSAAVYAIDRPYLYLLQGEQSIYARPGMRAVVPFGKGDRPTEGIILNLCDPPEETDYSLKRVCNLLDERPVLDEKAIQLALWMRERLFCTVYEAARAMLPAGLYYELKNRCVLDSNLTREEAMQAAGKSAAQQKLLEIVFANEDGVTLEDLRAGFGEQSPDAALRRLRQAGVIRIDTSVSRRIGDKTERYVSLAVPAEEAFELVEPTRKRWPVRVRIVEVLAGLERVSVKELCYFTGAGKSVLRTMEKKGILRFEEQEVYRAPESEQVEQELPPVLNGEQQTAFEGLQQLMRAESPACALLYGVTGSGKTQIYIRLIHACLEQGRNAVILVPEIALTPQMLRQFRAQFGGTVAVLHSRLPVGQRYDEWKRVRDGEARVVIGTRSAVFAPVKNLGLLIMDEEQEYSYKSENTPRYHARDIAKYRSVQNHALLLLGSATPSVESMFMARSGKYHLFTLKRRYNQRPMPQVLLADMREELRSGNPGNLSEALRLEIAHNLGCGEQTILFLNRRGTSRKVVCSQCGGVPSCDRCSVSYTYHKDNGRLMCHYCGGSRPLPRACPSCGGTLTFIGCGTQKIVEELHAAFPGTPVLRMDQDTLSAGNTHEKMLRRFSEEKIPILVGTQMVAKGLDFENVTLVGVVDADQSLYFESFRAAERTFSLLTQVIGRAGRGGRSGRAIIQTVSPGNSVITLAACQDYDGFYEQEIEMRRLRTYPPFCEHCRLTLSGENEGDVLRAGVRLREGADQWLRLPQIAQAGVKLYGPVAAPILRVNNRYRYQLNLYGTACPALRQMLSELLRAAFQDKQNHGVTVFADWNPLD